MLKDCGSSSRAKRPPQSRRNSCIYDAERPRRAHHSEISGGKHEILVIDDDSTNQIVFQDALEPNGYQVTAAMDGVEALELLASRSFLPDLILLDIQMPKMTGYEVCSEIRRLYPESMPIIMISANHDESSILKGLNVGSNDYVEKPFSRAQLLARIETHIHSRDSWMAEHKRSNDLLGQVFPEHITQKLKDGETVCSESHDCVTVLFSDIVGFTKMSTSIESTEVFEMLNSLYTVFDSLCDKHGVFKVDTIGDAYMVVAGHVEGSKIDHAARVYAMAKEMVQEVEKSFAPDGSRMKIRVGLHSGPASFGIVGVKCPKYTLIGDTVNLASRMESNGFPMCIHVSAVTRDLLHDDGGWCSVGLRDIKGKGKMETYIAKFGEWEEALAGLQCGTPMASLGGSSFEQDNVTSANSDATEVGASALRHRTEWNLLRPGSFLSRRRSGAVDLEMVAELLGMCDDGRRVESPAGSRGGPVEDEARSPPASRSRRGSACSSGGCFGVAGDAACFLEAVGCFAAQQLTTRLREMLWELELVRRDAAAVMADLAAVMASPGPAPQEGCSARKDAVKSVSPKVGASESWALVGVKAAAQGRFESGWDEDVAMSSRCAACAAARSARQELAARVAAAESEGELARAELGALRAKAEAALRGLERKAHELGRREAEARGQGARAMEALRAENSQAVGLLGAIMSSLDRTNAELGSKVEQFDRLWSTCPTVCASSPSAHAGLNRLGGDCRCPSLQNEFAAASSGWGGANCGKPSGRPAAADTLPPPTQPPPTPMQFVKDSAAADGDAPCGHAFQRAMVVLADGLLAASKGRRRHAARQGVKSCSSGHTEVDELVGFLGLGHYAANLRRDEVETLRVLASLSDAQLQAAGVASAGSRMLLLGAARGLRILMDCAAAGQARQHGDR